MNVQTIWDSMKEKFHSPKGQKLFKEDLILSAMVETRLQLTRELQDISMHMNVAVLIQEIADLDPEYETEYAGRMERYCHYCDAYLTNGGPHSEDCLHVKLKEALNAIQPTPR